MKKTGWALLPLLIAGLYAHSLYADNPPASPQWSPWLDIEADPGLHRTLGQADAFAPILRNDTSFLFLNPRYRLDDLGSQEYNFGIGYRTLWQNELVLGGYAYFDRQESDLGNYFSQSTLGVEALGRDLKFRFNDYEPLATRQYDGINPNASLSGDNLQINSTSEVQLRGDDAEIGYRIPVYDTESFKQLWIYGGGYRFDASNASMEAGPRARMEYEVRDFTIADRELRLRLSAEWEHDPVRDTQMFVGLRIGIPLGPTGSREDTHALSALERHMLDPVQRDVDIVAGTKVISQPAINDYNNQVISNVTTVSAGVNVPAAVTAAGANSVVIFNGASGAINVSSNTTVNMSNGQTFLGGGSALPVRGAVNGMQATYIAPGTAPSLVGSTSTLEEGLIYMAPNSIIKGMTITNYTGNIEVSSIVADNAPNFTIIDNNIISSGDSAWGMYIKGTSSGVIENNIISATSLDNTRGIEAENSAPLTITNNVISALNQGSITSYGIALYGVPNSTIAGNIVTATDGYPITNYNSPSTNISNNIVNTSQFGMAGIYNTGSGSTNVTINNNIINIDSAGALSAIYLENGSSATVNNNTINSAGTITLGAITYENAAGSGSGNIFSGSPLCATYGGNSGSIGFIGGGHCP